MFCNFHFSDDQSRWQLLEEGQIIAHFLGRSYDLHIYFGIFCTGCMEEEAKELRNGKSEYEKKKKEGQKAAGGTPDHLYIAKSLFLDNAEKFGLRIDKILDERDMTPDLSYYGPAAYRYTVYATKVAPVKD